MQTKPAPKKTEPHEMPANPPAPFERDIKNCEAVLAVAVMALEQAKDAPYVELYGALAKQRGISPRQMAAVFERYRQDSKLLEMLDTGPSAQLLTTELKDGRVFTFPGAERARRPRRRPAGPPGEHREDQSPPAASAERTGADRGNRRARLSERLRRRQEADRRAQAQERKEDRLSQSALKPPEAAAVSD